MGESDPKRVMMFAAGTQAWHLKLAQAAWVGLAVTILILSVISLPISLNRAHRLCQSPDCVTFAPNEINRLSAEDVRALEAVGISTGQYAYFQIGFLLVYSLVNFALSFLLFWYASKDRMARFMAFALLLWSLFIPPSLYEVIPANWHWAFNLFIGAPYQVAWLLMFFLFPDGRFRPGWVAPFALLQAALLVLGLVFPGSILDDQRWTFWYGLLIFGILSVFTQVYKYTRTSTPQERSRTKFVVFALAGLVPIAMLAVIFIGSLGFDQPGLPRLVIYPSITLTTTLVSAAFGIAVLRDRLWNVDALLNRVLVYSSLTFILGGGYVLIVGGLSLFLQTRGNLLIALFGTGLVALLLQPLHVRLQRAVNRFMYGQQDNPYAVISRLEKQLASTLELDAILPTIVKTLQESFLLPYVAISSLEEKTFRLVASTGKPVPNPLILPLLYQGNIIGQLLIGRHVPGSLFHPDQRRDQQEKKTLADLAYQAGIALHMIRLTTDLQQSRQQLVAAREEERRRLRRNLHDGLGPALATQVVRLETARDMLGRDPASAASLLSDLIQDAQDTIDEIRRLVHDLRPPTLDELGLLPALREQADKFRQHNLSLSLDFPAELPPLPAAVEVAFYRIVQESLTNVVKHARARHCTLRCRWVKDWIDLNLEDDGMGIPADHPPGVGLHSMRERAEEIGGSLSIRSIDGKGTSISVRLPIWQTGPVEGRKQEWTPSG